MTFKFDKFQEEIDRLDEKFDLIQEGMSKGIYEAVKKANV